MRRSRFVAVAAAVMVLAATPGALSSGASAPKPHVVWKPIPFGEKRKHQMAAYSERHYGKREWRLIDPKVVVEHFTGGDCFSCAWNTFASNSPDLGELPGTCAHFIVDRDGTIYQLVKLGIRCRHAVGMNWTAFGVEMVGTSDRAIMDRPRQFMAALRLTLWLMDRFDIQLQNVIGHNESLMSPYHHERYRSWRCQTHGDWNHADMKILRRKLKRMANNRNVPIGPWPPHWVDSGC